MTTTTSHWTTPPPYLRWIAVLSISVAIMSGVAWYLFQSATSMPTPSAHRIEPKAGTWQTYVIASGQTHRLPAPPDRATTQAELAQLKTLVAQRDTAALAKIAFWDTGAPSYRWNELTIEHSLKRNLPVNFASRHLSLVHVAIYDAMVAAWDTKYAYHRPRPSELDPSLSTVVTTPASPAYPAEHAIAAGAAAAVLSYLFPDDAASFTAKAEEAAQSRLMAGVNYPSDVTAGLELGRAVAARVIERAKTDGTDAKWTGAVPQGPGLWNGTNPALPQAATWKAWTLASNNEFRPGPPPAYDSAQMQAELDEVRSFQRTPKTNADAFFWEYAVGGLRIYQYWGEQTSKKILEYRLDANPPRAARAYALQSVALFDAGIACWDAKYTYWAIRPGQLDPAFKTLFATPNHPSYPSAHSCFSTASAYTLSYLFPNDAPSLNALATAAGESRIWAGLHFRSDVTAGEAIGRQVAAKAIARIQGDELQ